MQEDRGPSLGARARALHLNVAIDGPAGAGKTTIGSGLARVLEIPVLDTGLMYRSVTKHLIQLPDPTIQSAAGVASTIRFDLRGEGSEARLLASGEVLEESELHAADIDRAVPAVAANPEVRRLLVEEQRRLARARAIVMLGRDIGTVVLPDAPVKLFVTADPEVRAARRQADRPAEPNLREEIQRRDTTDAGRTVSPMKPASDAISLDTSNLTIDQSVDRVLQHVTEALNRLEQDR